VQAMCALPLSVDSSNLEVIEAGLAACDTARSRPLLNSASLERVDALDMAAKVGAQVMVTAAGDSGMPDGVEERLDNATRMVEAARAKGFALNDIFIDPLYFPVSVDTAYGQHGLDAIRAIRARFGPEVHISGGMSNVSFGIPARKTINEVFLLLALEAGADSGIIDPVASPPNALLAIDRESPSYKLAEDVILDRDKHCKNFIRAWRKGELSPLAVGA
jgi:cobalamin-dependent methionine synthase I